MKDKRKGCEDPFRSGFGALRDHQKNGTVVSASAMITLNSHSAIGTCTATKQNGMGSLYASIRTSPNFLSFAKRQNWERGALIPFTGGSAPMPTKRSFANGKYPSLALSVSGTASAKCCVNTNAKAFERNANASNVFFSWRKN